MARVLVVGSGGREHTLAEFLSRSPQVKAVFTAPGNAGTPGNVNLDISGSDSFSGLADFVQEEGIDLTVVGPEAPLCAGIVDVFEARGLKIFGPSRAAARLEGDKAFSRRFMKTYGIPHPEFSVFQNLNDALCYLEELPDSPIVVKAAGLAGGKGALVCTAKEEAKQAVELMMGERRFGAAGDTVVIEEFMEGEEASILAVCDGRHPCYLASSQDHKQIYEGDQGPNTGGMGAYAPTLVVTDEVLRKVDQSIIRPALRGMTELGTPYRGCLYAGLMIKDGQPKVVEFNCRFGDPETQVVLPLLENDFYELLVLAIEEKLDEVDVKTCNGAACCVVLASGGYPEKYEKGKLIEGLEKAAELDDLFVFHAGTQMNEWGQPVTAGGRVLGITGLGDTIQGAVQRAYHGVDMVYFENCHCRRDIAHRALERLNFTDG